MSRLIYASNETKRSIAKTTRRTFFNLARKSRVLIIKGYRGCNGVGEKRGPLFFGIFNYTERNDCGRESRKNVTRNGTVM